MPKITLKMDYKRGNKVLPEGTIIPISWEGYREMLEAGYCDALPEDKPKKQKKKTKPKMED
tara:strand:- start:1919 stop:2101 length:183 start_codon:yes stop_codon:yes gene_type:complete